MSPRSAVVARQVDSRVPAPRASVAGLAHEVHRARLEDLPADAIVGAVGAGDVLFYDGSHRALENSDATVFFLEVLPRPLPAIAIP